MLNSHKDVNVIADIGVSNSFIGLSGSQSPQLATPSYLVEDTSCKDNQFFISNNLLDSQTSYEIRSLFDNNGTDSTLNCERFSQFIETALIDKLSLRNQLLSMLITEDVEPLKVSAIAEKRQRISQFMFQQLNVRNLCFVKKPVLSVFSLGRASGVVIDSGYSATRASVVHDGFCLNSLVANYGGFTIDELILQKIGGSIKLPEQQLPQPYKQSWLQYKRQAELQRIKLMFPSDYEASSQTMKDCEYTDRIEYTLPDGSEINIARDELVDPFIHYPKFWRKYIDSLNQPDPIIGSRITIPWKVNQWYRSLAKMGIQTLQVFLKGVLSEQQSHIKQQMLNNFILVGGNLNFADISTGTSQQLLELQPKSQTVLSLANNCQNSNSSAWVGGSIVSEMISFAPFWITHEQWKESGNKSLLKQTTVKVPDIPSQQNSTTINLGALTGISPLLIPQHKPTQNLLKSLSQSQITSLLRSSRMNLINKKCP